MLKHILVGKLTTQAAVKSEEVGSASESVQAITKEEKVLLDFLIEVEPELFPELASYWLYTCFICTASHEIKNTNDKSSGVIYSQVQSHLLALFEQNPNLVLYNLDSFKKWLSFIRKMPVCNSKEVVHHIEKILQKVRMANLRQFGGELAEQALVKKFSFKQEFGQQLLQMFVDMLYDTKAEYSRFRALLDLFFSPTTAIVPTTASTSEGV